MPRCLAGIAFSLHHTYDDAGIFCCLAGIACSQATRAAISKRKTQKSAGIVICVMPKIFSISNRPYLGSPYTKKTSGRPSELEFCNEKSNVSQFSANLENSDLVELGYLCVASAIPVHSYNTTHFCCELELLVLLMLLPIKMPKPPK